MQEGRRHLSKISANLTQKILTISSTARKKVGSRLKPFGGAKDKEGAFANHECFKALGHYLTIVINKLLKAEHSGDPHIINTIPEIKQGI